jgi:hypothetical protein
MKAEIILDGGEEYPIPLYADRIRSIYFQRGRTIYADVVDNLTREYTTGELEEAFPGLLAACKETYPALDWSAYTP